MAVEVDHGERYDAKREAGISERRTDGSLTSRETDVQAGSAEQFAAEYFGQRYNSDVYSNHGDGGADFYLRGIPVEVVHLGMKDGAARRDGNLIVNPHEPWRHAPVYIVVRGSVDEGFEFAGWLDDVSLKARPLENFGYGPRHACPVSDLAPITTLERWADA